MNKKDLFFVSLLTFFITLFSILPLFAIEWLFNHVFDYAYHSLLWLIALGLIALCFSASLFLYARHVTLLRLSGDFGNRVQSAFWHRLFLLQWSYFKTASKRSLFEKMMGVEAFRDQLYRHGAEMLGASFFSILYLGAMMCFSLAMTGIALIVIALDLFLFFFFVRKKNHLKRQVASRESHRGSLLTESLCALEKVRASGAEKRLFEMWKRDGIQIAVLKQKLATLTTLLDTLQQFTPFFILALLLLTSSIGWTHSSIGSFFAFYLALVNFCLALREGMRASLETPFFKKGEQVFPDLKETSGEEKISLKGGILVEQGEKRWVFRPGEKVGIAASSDLTTTRLVRFLLGFEIPEQGKVLFDGKEFSSLDWSHVRSQIGTVFRTEGVFAGTIEDNLLVGRTYSEQEIGSALQLSGFDEDLKTFRMGLNTLVPEGGGTLSSGQKQRLLLARALCGNPAILILDQGIDALDPASREQVLRHLQQLPSTQIIISHHPDVLAML